MQHYTCAEAAADLALAAYRAKVHAGWREGKHAALHS